MTAAELRLTDRALQARIGAARELIRDAFHSNTAESVLECVVRLESVAIPPDSSFTLAFGSIPGSFRLMRESSGTWTARYTHAQANPVVLFSATSAALLRWMRGMAGR